MRIRLAGVTPVLAASLITAVGLVVVGWFDYSATRAELLRLLRDQATALRQTIAAAARSNEAAGVQAEAQIGERLLDNARLLAELDRRGALTQATLDEAAARNRLFRATVFGRDGTRELSNAGRGGTGFGDGSGPPPWAGRGNQAQGGGPGAGGGRAVGMGGGRGMGPGGGRGMAEAGALVDRLLGGEAEAVSGLHPARGWGGGSRIAAGVRRAGGGAIVLNADASEIAALAKQTSLEGLVRDIASNTPDLAYIVLDGPELHLAVGDPPPEGEAAPGEPVSEPAVANEDLKPGERERVVKGRPVLDQAGNIALGAGRQAVLRLGLRLDGLRQTQNRLVVRLVISLAGALVVSMLAFWWAWLRKAYGVLSEKHALAEAALRRRDRLSAMGELAATVAHEVRNPLNAIAMSARRLRREFLDAVKPASEQDSEDLGQLLGVVEQETQRINTIVQQFLEFARPPRLSMRSVDLGEVVRASAEAHRAMAATGGVTLETNLQAASAALVDPDQLRQGVENLVRNAIEATPAGGTVHVSAASSAEEHVIEVRDTGTGIDPEHMGRLFDLYFTTKANGTGVGLAVTQQIVTAHGGTIEVTSAPGKGTSMTIRLPVAAVEAVNG